VLDPYGFAWGYPRSAWYVYLLGQIALGICGHGVMDANSKYREEQLAELNRALQTLHQCNLALIHATEEGELLRSICEILMEFGEFRMVWVGYREDDEKKSVRPVAFAGVEDGYLQGLEITWADNERGQGPSGTAVRTGKPSWAKNIREDKKFAPWQQYAIARGYASSLSLPLKRGEQTFGVLSLYSGEAAKFNEQSFEQYVELAENLAYGIATLRTREERKHAEEALRRSQAYLEEGQRLTHTGSWAWNVARQENVYWSDEQYRIYGFDPEHDAATYKRAFERIHPDDQSGFLERLTKALAGKHDFEFDYRVLLPDGTLKYLRTVGHPVLNEAGEVVEMVGTGVDITEQTLADGALQKAFEEIRTLKDKLYEENLALREEIDQASMFEEIIGSSAALQEVLSRIAKVAPSDSTVLITGETGTGKELVARAIHKRSQRAGRAFVSVNCAAIPGSLIASELFGHEKGAFTGALQRRIGRFELAEGGTIFLDEIGELSAETQIALLRVLQEREFERVGSSHAMAVNVRVIAATNRDLIAAAAVGTFRMDLFYRLNVFPIDVPPLRQRIEDIPLLVRYFIDRYSLKVGKNITRIEKRTMDLLSAYQWPGNIRELQNVIERSVILCDSDVFAAEASWFAEQHTGAGGSRTLLNKKLEEQERELIEAALAETNGRVAGNSGAAARLGVPASTLESKIRTLGIRKAKFKTA
jgi:transcriptional regulator with GAF, ATPase, and Fis domain